MQITVLNWSKYNPRNDVARPSWLRFESSLFEKPNFFDFTRDELGGGVYILCVASKKNGEPFLVNFKHLEKIGRTKKQVFLDCVEKLVKLQIVHVGVTSTGKDVTSTGEHVTCLPATGVTGVTGETGREDGTERVEPTALDSEKAVLELLNKSCGRSFKPTEANLKPIRARLKEGYKQQDFETVILSKKSQWGSDEKMQAYLRPATLFGTKFDSYLQSGAPMADPLIELFEQALARDAK